MATVTHVRDDGIIDDIQVKNGIYCIKYFDNGALTEINFIYGDISSMNRDEDFMNISHSQILREYSRDPELHMNDRAVYLRENIGELRAALKDIQLPKEVRKAINSI